MTVDGLSRFARFAYPPNARGYCGPAEHEALRTYARTGVIDDRLIGLASAFDGPLPYLRTIAGPDGDPFSEAVMEAYWIGNDLLRDVDRDRFAKEVERVFRGQPTVDWDRVEAALAWGAPHHMWHVLVTYPWLGMLDEPGDHAVRILDQCRIRRGRVEAVDDAADGVGVVVRSRPLTRDGPGLALGAERVEPGRAAVSDEAGAVQPGDWVALHWEWACDRLTDAQAAALEHWSASQLELVNRHLLC